MAWKSKTQGRSSLGSVALIHETEEIADSLLAKSLPYTQCLQPPSSHPHSGPGSSVTYLISCLPSKQVESQEKFRPSTGTEL